MSTRFADIEFPKGELASYAIIIKLLVMTVSSPKVVVSSYTHKSRQEGDAHKDFWHSKSNVVLNRVPNHMTESN